jgi:hypothetical protein
MDQYFNVDLSGWENCECSGCGVTIPGGWRFQVQDNRLNAPKPAYEYKSMHCPYCGEDGISLTAKVSNE